MITTAGVIPHPDHVFMTAMSRVSYIVIGIACEGVMEAIFSVTSYDKVKNDLQEIVISSINDVLLLSSNLLLIKEDARVPSYRLLDKIVSQFNDIEFIEVEMRKRGCEGEHGRASLVLAARTLTQALALFNDVKDKPRWVGMYRERMINVAILLQDIAHLLTAKKDIRCARQKLKDFRKECSEKMSDYLTQRIETLGRADDISSFDEYILLSSLDDLVGDMSLSLKEYETMLKPVRGDHFRFNFHLPTDKKQALLNGLGACSAILVSGLIWKCTAWPTALDFINVTCVFCAQFAIKENPYLASMRFLIGGAWAAIVSFFLDFFFLPAQSTYEMMAAYFFVPMIGGGLAVKNSKTVVPAASYNFLMPILVHPMNQNRWDEISWLNSTFAIMLCVVFLVFIFRVVMPLDVTSICQHIYQRFLYDLQMLTNRSSNSDKQEWTIRSLLYFSRIRRTKDSQETKVNHFDPQNILSISVIGEHVISLKQMLKQRSLPLNIQNAVDDMLRKLALSLQNGRYRPYVTLVLTKMLNDIKSDSLNIPIKKEILKMIAHIMTIDKVLQRHIL